MKILTEDEILKCKDSSKILKEHLRVIQKMRGNKAKFTEENEESIDRINQILTYRGANLKENAMEED